MIIIAVSFDSSSNKLIFLVNLFNIVRKQINFNVYLLYDEGVLQLNALLYDLVTFLILLFHNFIDNTVLPEDNSLII